MCSARSLSHSSRARAQARLAVRLSYGGIRAPGFSLDHSGGGQTICLQRRPDGSAYFRIDKDPRTGYLIWGEGRGHFLLSPDAHCLTCAPDPCPQEVWQRFLIGQVLPLAALVSGLEILHASAVVIDGRAVAFVGPSGAGKTSLALELCRNGAEFLADDVLALEPKGSTPMAQPGTPLAGIDHNEARRVQEAGVPLGGEVIATNAREQIARIEGAMSPFPLAAIFFLDRRGHGVGGPTFEPYEEAGALLGSTFNFVLDSPERMVGLLDICALLARQRVERAVIPPSVDASRLAATIMSRLDRSA